MKDKQLSIKAYKKEHRNCPLCQTPNVPSLTLSLAGEEGQSSRYWRRNTRHRPNTEQFFSL